MKRLLAIALIGLAVGAGSRSLAEGEETSSARIQDTTNPLALLGPDALGEFLAKPLFAPSRIAPPKTETNADVIETSVASIQIPKIQVVGVVQTPKETIAQVIDLADQSRYSIRAGDFIGQWTVVSIDRSSVTMGMEDQKQVFTVEAVQPDASPSVAPAVGTKATDDNATWASDADRIGFFGKNAAVPK